MYSNVKMLPVGGYHSQQEIAARSQLKEGGFAQHLESQLSSLEQPAASPANKNTLEDELGKRISDLNDYVQSLQRALKFSVDEGTGQVVVKVLDKATQQVIRQIPAEETLVIASRLEAAVGVFVSEEA
jgi:flagellar protein FlaG